MLEPSQKPIGTSLAGFERTAFEQALENLDQALRALDMAPRSDSDLCPHPLVVVRAEIENARRYLCTDTVETPRFQGGRTSGPTRRNRQHAEQFRADAR